MKALKTQFPDSNRVKLLEGQLYEAEGKNPLGIYEAILEADPSNVTAMKRRVCVYRAQNNNRLAVRELNAYLSLYSTDSSAWQELTQLYIEQEKLELSEFVKKNYHETRMLYSFGIIEGMLFLYENGIKFHDLHPGNVMARGNNIVIIDLGLSDTGDINIDKIEL